MIFDMVTLDNKTTYEDFVIKSYSIEAMDIEPNKLGTFTRPLNDVLNHKPIAIVCYGVTGTGSSCINIYNCYLTADNKVQVYIRNMGSSTATPTLNFKVLYVKG